MFKYNLLASQRRVKLLSILSVFLFVVLFPLRGMNGLTLPFMELKLVDSYVIHAGFALSIPFVIHALRVNNIFGIYAKCVYSAIVLIWLVSIISNIYLDLPTEDVHGINVRAFQIGVAYYSLVYLVCGYSFAAYGIFGNERIYIFLFVAYTILSIAQIDSSILQVNFYSVADEYSGNYLMVADLYAIVALLVASSATNWTFRYAVIVLALFVLYILYSRTSFFVFLMVVCFAELVFNKKQALIRWFILFSLVFAVIAIGLALGDGDGFASNRMLSVFIAEQDGSAIERVVQFDSGLSRLYDRWIVGDYAGQSWLWAGLGRICTIYCLIGSNMEYWYFC